MRTLLQQYVDRHVMAGCVVLVATRDKILSLDAVGYADLEATKPMMPDSVFWIASMSKPMTGAALMMLVDQGKVDLDDPVEKYLPEFKGQKVLSGPEPDAPLRKPARPMQVRDTLSHTSGLPFCSPHEGKLFDVRPLAELAREYATLPLKSDPGTKYEYSNAGINIAGRIIEVAGGVPYEKFMDERLFKPLGMKDTTFWPNKDQIRRMAASYKPDEGKTGLEKTNVDQLTYPLDNPKRQPLAGGGLFSAAEDVLRFCRMVLNCGVFEGKRYLSTSSVKAMTSRQTPASIQESYGFGWGVGEEDFGHGGAYRTNMSIDPARGLITIFLVQQAGWAGPEGDGVVPAVNAAARTLLEEKAGSALR